MATEATSSPPPAASTTPSSRSSSSRSSSRPSLSLDLSNLPPLSQPSPPSNTLLITDLHDLFLFQPSSLASIRAQITAVAPLNSFSPLPSLRRIVCSFLSTDDAIRVRQHLEAEGLIDRKNVRARIYFGEPTPIESTEEARRRKLLEAPHAQKLFFISPPPSPPQGWVSRPEDPPNKEVHASDLAEALARLRTEQQGIATDNATASNDPASPVSVSSSDGAHPQVARTGSWPVSGSGQRSRSSTIIYHPSDHGSSPNLPAVMVEDTSAGDGDDDDLDVDMSSPVDSFPPQRKKLIRTARPPVELME
ncbi:hypothetical protein VTN96DRAFT_8531 [Rasamsonia emersonii]|uniref:Calcineurin binding protein n=1 Tax=Rasamsonia emersonii (strain ATCC 16479 / CBS 393.64 / IMI 116815) TaxID=1408163 RepID=A0A0F4YRR7_RASE3|nr:Calcineurin binding protein [Rasamsonia emersonii CBS 393.64]KKA20775.1 Calcineurin binding protein [Rasamsonia emersonii CBS 393.64]